MNSYTDKRLQELRDMSTEEVAKRPIRKTTPPRVKAVILRAREKVYNEAHDATPGKRSFPKELKDGDVLLMRKHNTLSQRVISGVTGSPYTHAAVYSKGKVYDSLNATDKTKNKGGNINTFTEFSDRDKGLTYDVFRPKERATAREAARNIERVTRNTTGYSMANAVQAGLRDRFGYGITTNYDKNFRICSELVYDAFNGLIGNDASSSVSPGRLAKNKNLEKVHTLRLSNEEFQQ